MKEGLKIAWVIISIILISIIILREPNVESIGAIIQESQYNKDSDSEKKIDRIILITFIIFIILTVFLFLQI